MDMNRAWRDEFDRGRPAARSPPAVRLRPHVQAGARRPAVQILREHGGLSPLVQREPAGLAGLQERWERLATSRSRTCETPSTATESPTCSSARREPSSTASRTPRRSRASEECAISANRRPRTPSHAGPRTPEVSGPRIGTLRSTLRRCRHDARRGHRPAGRGGAGRAESVNPLRRDRRAPGIPDEPEQQVLTGAGGIDRRRVVPDTSGTVRPVAAPWHLPPVLRHPSTLRSSRSAAA